jgi:hypothetical protein
MHSQIMELGMKTMYERMLPEIVSLEMQPGDGGVTFVIETFHTRVPRRQGEDTIPGIKRRLAEELGLDDSKINYTPLDETARITIDCAAAQVRNVLSKLQEPLLKRMDALVTRQRQK